MRANARAVALGDLSVAADLTRASGRHALPVGLAPSPADGPRLAQAIEGIIVDPSVGPKGTGYGGMTRQEQNDLFGRLRAGREQDNATRRQARADRVIARAGGTEGPNDRVRREREADRSRERRARSRLERLANNEPRERASEARGTAIARSRYTTGWKRVSSGVGCPACENLAARDVVLSPGTSMWRHTGCSCTQVPTTQRR